MRYDSGAAFRRALEDRLRVEGIQDGKGGGEGGGKLFEKTEFLKQRKHVNE